MDCVVADAVLIEPVSAIKFPSITEKNREFFKSKGSSINCLPKNNDVPDGWREIPCKIESGILW